MTARVLDVTAGSRMMWFDRNDDRAIFLDNRQEDTELCDGRNLTIDPEMVGDFRALPFEEETFYHVVFDPPTPRTAGKELLDPR